MESANPHRCTADTPALILPVWELYVDGSCNNQDSGAGIVLIDPDDNSYGPSLRFKQYR